MTYCITSRRGTSKLLELVPNPFDDINKICSKQKQKTIITTYTCLNDKKKVYKIFTPYDIIFRHSVELEF